MFSGDAGVSPAKTLGFEKRQCPGAVIVQTFLNLSSADGLVRHRFETRPRMAMNRQAHQSLYIFR